MKPKKLTKKEQQELLRKERIEKKVIEFDKIVKQNDGTIAQMQTRLNSIDSKISSQATLISTVSQELKELDIPEPVKISGEQIKVDIRDILTEEHKDVFVKDEDGKILIKVMKPKSSFGLLLVGCGIIAFLLGAYFKWQVGTALIGGSVVLILLGLALI